MSKKKILQIAKERWSGRFCVNVDGWSINGWGKWTAELLETESSFQIASGTDGTKRLAAESLLQILENFSPEEIGTMDTCIEAKKSLVRAGFLGERFDPDLG